MKMLYYIAQPKQNFKLYGTMVELDDSNWYLILHANNQPDNQNKYFVIYIADGHWEIEDHGDVDGCTGLLLESHELIFHDETFEELEDALDVLHQLNT